VLTSGADDPFGHLDYVRTLLALVVTARFGMTVGLFGPWGTGKTTILEEIGRRLNAQYRPLVAYACFDAWRYEGDSLRREFVREIAEQLINADAVRPGFDSISHLRSFDADVAESASEHVKFDWKPLFVSLAAGIGAALAIGGAYLLLPLLDVSSETVIKIELVLLGGLATFLFVALGRSIAPVRTLETKRRFEYPDQFARSFDSLLAETTPERIVIGIDNLDRCSPDRVAEILTAIKTFLEPASDSLPGRPSLVFVVAADDQALRRHLEAKEAALLGASSIASGDPRLRDIQHAVSEYLRKFFNAHIHISEALDEDMESFVERELGPFFAARPIIGTDTKARLIELTSYGLKRNPRRVKQFVNNLGLRLDLFDQRFDAKRIQEKPGILAMAKLVMLEEEHPDRYRELLDDHSLLTSWHEAASSGEAPVGNDGEFTGFLLFTASIQIRDLPAYLKSKQTEAELALPDYGEFASLLEDGNASGITELLEAESRSVRQEYVEATQRLFDEQRRRQAWRRAQNVLRCVVEVKALHGTNGACVRHVLRNALDNALRERLVELDTAALLDAARSGLQQSEFDLVVDAVLSGIDGSEPREDPARVLGGFVPFVSDLDDGLNQRLRSALENEDLAGRFAAYVPLVEASHWILGSTPVRLALDAVREDSSLGIDEPATRILLTASAAEDATQDLVDRTIESIRGMLLRLGQGESDAYAHLVERIMPLIPRSGDEAVAGVVEDIAGHWNDLTEGNLFAAARLGVRICLNSSAAADSFGETLGARLADVGQSRAVGGYLADEYSVMPDQVRQGVRRRLGEIVGDEREGAGAALSLVDELPSEDRIDVLSTAGERAVTSGHPAAVRALLEQVHPEEAESLVTQVLDQIDQGPAQMKAWRPVVERLVESQETLGPEQIERLARAMILAPRADKKLFDLASLVGRLEVAGDDARTQLVRELIETERLFTAAERRAALLGGADSLAGAEESAAHAVVEERLGELGAGRTQRDKQVARLVLKAREDGEAD
jgi:hypothetical protein